MSEFPYEISVISGKRKHEKRNGLGPLSFADQRHTVPVVVCTLCEREIRAQTPSGVRCAKDGLCSNCFARAARWALKVGRLKKRVTTAWQGRGFSKWKGIVADFLEADLLK